MGFMGPVGVRIVLEAGMEEEGMFWKMWMGRASKNSWARMKGVEVASVVVVSFCMERTLVM